MKVLICMYVPTIINPKQNKTTFYVCEGSGAERSRTECTEDFGVGVNMNEGGD